MSLKYKLSRLLKLIQVSTDIGTADTHPVSKAFGHFIVYNYVNEVGVTVHKYINDIANDNFYNALHEIDSKNKGMPKSVFIRKVLYELFSEDKRYNIIFPTCDFFLIQKPNSYCQLVIQDKSIPGYTIKVTVKTPGEVFLHNAYIIRCQEFTIVVLHYRLHSNQKIMACLYKRSVMLKSYDFVIKHEGYVRETVNTLMAALVNNYVEKREAENDFVNIDEEVLKGKYIHYDSGLKVYDIDLGVNSENSALVDLSHNIFLLLVASYGTLKRYIGFMLEFNNRNRWHIVFREDMVDFLEQLVSSIQSHVGGVSPPFAYETPFSTAYKTSSLCFVDNFTNTESNSELYTAKCYYDDSSGYFYLLEYFIYRNVFILHRWNGHNYYRSFFKIPEKLDNRSVGSYTMNIIDLIHNGQMNCHGGSVCLHSGDKISRFRQDALILDDKTQNVFYFNRLIFYHPIKKVKIFENEQKNMYIWDSKYGLIPCTIKTPIDTKYAKLFVTNISSNKIGIMYDYIDYVRQVHVLTIDMYVDCELISHKEMVLSRNNMAWYSSRAFISISTLPHQNGIIIKITVLEIEDNKIHEITLFAEASYDDYRYDFTEIMPDFYLLEVIPDKKLIILYKSKKTAKYYAYFVSKISIEKDRFLDKSRVEAFVTIERRSALLYLLLVDEEKYKRFVLPAKFTGSYLEVSRKGSLVLIRVRCAFSDKYGLSILWNSKGETMDIKLYRY